MKKIYIALLLAVLGLSGNGYAQAPELVWAGRVGGTSSDGASSIAVDANGNIYTTGLFSGTADFDPGIETYNLSSGGTEDAFISKLDAFGNFVWAKKFSGAGEVFASSITVDINGNIYTTGFFQGVADFDPGTETYNLTSVGGNDVFVCKLNANGDLIWAAQIGGMDSDAGNSIAIDANGNVYTTGVFQGTVDFNPGAGTFTLNAIAGSSDIFVSKLDSAGNFLWAIQMGGAGSDSGTSNVIDTKGNIYTTGGFIGTADFDPSSGIYNLTSIAGSSDIFVSKLDSAGNFLWAIQMGGTGSDRGKSIAVDSNGNAYTTGDFRGIADFDPGPGTYNLTSAGTNDIFVSKLDSAGNFLWAIQMGISAFNPYSPIGSIAADANGDIYITGYFRDTVDFDPGTGIYNLNSVGGNDVFISKLDASGSFLWAIQMGGTSAERGKSIAIDINGDVYTTGDFANTTDFDPGIGTNYLTSAGASDIFIVKLSQPQPSPSWLGLYANDTINHPFLGPEILLDSVSINQPVPNAVNICADGSKTTVVKYVNRNPFIATANIRFRVKSEMGIDASGFFYPADYTYSGDTVIARLTHPTFVVPTIFDLRPDDIEVVNNANGTTIYEYPIKVHRAPIVFVHGLWGGPSTFQAMSSAFFLDVPFMKRVDYSYTNGASYFTNRNVVKLGIDNVLLQARNEKFSAGKAIVIGHSMGGILARLYLQSTYPPFYRDDIIKLITLNTPHYGTQIANYFWTHPKFIPLVNDAFSYSNDGDYHAIEDLQVNSYATTHHLNIPQNIQNKVASTTFNTDGSGVGGLTASTIRLLTPKNIFYGEVNDLIVPQSSQNANLDLLNTIPNQIHLGSAENPAIINDCLTLLDENPATSINFTNDGFPQYTISPPAFLAPPPPPGNDYLGNDPDSIAIVSPAYGQQFDPGDSITVQLFSSGNITRTGLLVYGLSIDPIPIDTGIVSTIKFQIPPTAVGALNIWALGGDSTAWQLSDSVQIIAHSTSVPDSIVASPDTLLLPIGHAQAIRTLAYFSGTPVNISGAPGLSVGYDSIIAQQVAPGFFKGMTTGSMDVVVVYNGLSDTAYISVYDYPDALTASFNYSSNVVCANSSVQFSDASIGIPVSYAWTFPGGNPLASTLPNPVVAYPDPGNYAVGLKTWFTTGVDSITMNHFIQVNPPGVVLANVKVFLQGPYVSNVQLMHDSLRVKNLIPLTEPYTGLTNFTHVSGGGGEQTTPAVLTVTGPDAIVDWVFLELRSAADPALVLATRAALLQRDGDVVDVDGISPAHFEINPDQNFYLAIRHRNHFGVQLGVVRFFPECERVDADFRSLPPEGFYAFDGQNPAQRLVGNRYVLWAGNGRIDYQLKYNGSANDRLAILSLLGLATPNATVTGYHLTDYNMDGQVKYNGSANDRNVLLGNVGISAPSAILHDQIGQ